MKIERKEIMRVLLAAYQCAEGGGSVSQIGWEWFSRLSKKARVTLITHVRNRSALEKSGVTQENSDIIFIDTEWLAAPLWKIANKLFPNSEHAVFLLAQADFFIYDFLAKRAAKKRLQTGTKFDIVQVVTPVSPSAPTTLYKLGIPLIVGPLNGGLESPKNFPELMKADSAWLYPIKKLGRIFDFFIGSTRRAALILTATESTLKTFPEKYRAKCRAMIENGVDLDLFEPTVWQTFPAGSKNKPLKILFVGRLIPAKAVSLLLEAVKKVSGEFAVELEIIGDGPMREEWEKMSRELNLDGIVNFLGNKSLSHIAAAMKKCHVFCLPSVRESGGAVLLEAMAAARPLVAVAYGGPKEIVDEKIGTPIAADGREAVINSLAAAFRDVIANPEKWQQRGIEGRRRAENFYGWSAKINDALKIYQSLLKTRQTSESSETEKEESLRWITN